MGLYSISSKAGIYESSLIDLINGKASYNIASTLEVYESDLQDFLNGKASYNLAQKIGTYESDLQELLNKVRKKGAIGIIIGLLINENTNEQ